MKKIKDGNEIEVNEEDEEKMKIKKRQNRKIEIYKKS